MPKITIRYQKITDAKIFYEMLNNPNFVYLHVRPKSIFDEKKWLRDNPKRRKNNIEWNYTILFDNRTVGAIGIKINQHRKFIGEIGYFIDEDYWRRGIATQAVKLVEKEAFKKLGLTRIEIIMQPENVASEKVAIKAGYKKEGILRKAIEGKGKKEDAILYAKVK